MSRPAYVPACAWRWLAGLALCLALLPAARAAAPEPLLWKVESGHGSALYLLGSFHLLQADDYPPAPSVMAAFGDADRVVFELAPQELGAPALAAAMRQAGTRAGGRLQDELDPATWARLQALAAREGLALDALQGCKPWFVGLSLGVATMTRQGLDPALGLDRWFMERAAQAGKPTAGLERAQDQIALLDGMAAEEQRQLLDEALDQFDDDGGQARDLHDAWSAGDAARLQALAGEAMRRRYPRLYRRINVDRNRAWLPQLQDWLRPGQGDTLVVVGALHLLGEDGVVQGLAARGYRVRRICGSCQP